MPQPPDFRAYAQRWADYYRAIGEIATDAEAREWVDAAERHLLALWTAEQVRRYVEGPVNVVLQSLERVMQEIARDAEAVEVDA